MTSKIFYKFSSQQVGSIGEVTFTGQSIHIADLKNELVTKLSEGQGGGYAEFDVEVTDSEKNKLYQPDAMVPRNATVLIRRIPLVNPLNQRGRAPYTAAQTGNVASAGMTNEVPPKIKIERASSLDDFQDVFSSHTAATPSVGSLAAAKPSVDVAAKDKAQKEEEAIQSMAAGAANRSALLQSAGTSSSALGAGTMSAAKSLGSAAHAVNAVGAGRARGLFVPRTDNSQPLQAKAPSRRTAGIPKDLLTANAEADDRGRIQFKPDDSFDQKVKTHTVKALSVEEVQSRITSNPNIHVPDELRCKLTGELLKDAVYLPCCLERCSFEKISKALIDSGCICPLCKKSGITPERLQADKILREKVAGFIQEVRVFLEKSQDTSAAAGSGKVRDDDVPLPSNNKSDVVLKLGGGRALRTNSGGAAELANDGAVALTSQPTLQGANSEDASERSPLTDRVAEPPTAMTGETLDEQQQQQQQQPDGYFASDQHQQQMPPQGLGNYLSAPGHPNFMPSYPGGRGGYYPQQQGWMPRGPYAPFPGGHQQNWRGPPPMQGPGGWRGPPNVAMQGPWMQGGPPPRQPFFPRPQWQPRGGPRWGFRGPRPPFAPGFRPQGFASTMVPPGGSQQQLQEAGGLQSSIGNVSAELNQPFQGDAGNQPENAGQASEQSPDGAMTGAPTSLDNSPAPSIHEEEKSTRGQDDTALQRIASDEGKRERGRSAGQTSRRPNPPAKRARSRSPGDRNRTRHRSADPSDRRKRRRSGPPPSGSQTRREGGEAEDRGRGGSRRQGGARESDRGGRGSRRDDERSRDGGERRRDERRKDERRRDERDRRREDGGRKASRDDDGSQPNKSAAREKARRRNRSPSSRNLSVSGEKGDDAKSTQATEDRQDRYRDLSTTNVQSESNDAHAAQAATREQDSRRNRSPSLSLPVANVEPEAHSLLKQGAPPSLEMDQDLDSRRNRSPPRNKSSGRADRGGGKARSDSSTSAYRRNETEKESLANQSSSTDLADEPRKNSLKARLGPKVTTTTTSIPVPDPAKVPESDRAESPSDSKKHERKRDRKRRKN